MPFRFRCIPNRTDLFGNRVANRLYPVRAAVVVEKQQEQQKEGKNASGHLPEQPGLSEPGVPGPGCTVDKKQEQCLSQIYRERFRGPPHQANYDIAYIM